MSSIFVCDRCGQTIPAKPYETPLTILSGHLQTDSVKEICRTCHGEINDAVESARRFYAPLADQRVRDFIETTTERSRNDH